MKKIKFITLLIAFSLFFISIIPGESITRPTYALSETDSFITENDYELFFEDSSLVGTILTYTQMWIKPSACYPIDTGTPHCTGAFAAGYNTDSDIEKYDKDYFDAIKLALFTYAFVLDITHEVPGAEIAIVYAPIATAYSAIAYFGMKTGIFVAVAEVDTSYLLPQEDTYTINADYDKDGITEILVEIGEKVSDELNLPGFSTIITIGALVSMVTMVYLIRKKK
ncbi:MAG: hypothetical protein E3J70_04000 [Candidatus Heimdallarchaeota archaeon]|nr:MAG: hypothetical protein E3J70_04000 [Candidatus Heimdallarchaeota archaeon]